MKKFKTARFILSLLLSALIAVSVAGCGDDKNDKSKETNNSQSENREISFVFEITDPDGNVTSQTITTSEKTVGAALIEAGLIEGETSDYGLYVTKVNGITADYDADGAYWAFYVNGEYAMAGADSTEIKDGESYAFVYEKG